MKQFTVIMENGEKEKHVKVMATDQYHAFAVAQLKYKGWYPVDIA